jgi:hypothetical protein
MSEEKDARHEMARCLNALRLELPESIVRDVTERYHAALDEAQSENTRLKAEVDRIEKLRLFIKEQGNPILPDMVDTMSTGQWVDFLATRWRIESDCREKLQAEVERLQAALSAPTGTIILDDSSVELMEVCKENVRLKSELEIVSGQFKHTKWREEALKSEVAGLREALGTLKAFWDKCDGHLITHYSTSTKTIEKCFAALSSTTDYAQELRREGAEAERERIKKSFEYWAWNDGVLWFQKGSEIRAFYEDVFGKEALEALEAFKGGE